MTYISIVIILITCIIAYNYQRILAIKQIWCDMAEEFSLDYQCISLMDVASITGFLRGCYLKANCTNNSLWSKNIPSRTTIEVYYDSVAVNALSENRFYQIDSRENILMNSLSDLKKISNSTSGLKETMEELYRIYENATITNYRIKIELNEAICDPGILRVHLQAIIYFAEIMRLLCNSLDPKAKILEHKLLFSEKEMLQLCSLN